MLKFLSKSLVCLGILFVFTGCPKTNPPDPTPSPAVNTETHPWVRALCCGLTYTSPSGDYPAPGCDIDCMTLSSSAKDAGVRVVSLFNADCTWENIKEQAFTLTRGMERGDMFVFTLAGHGTQLSDDNGDEVDGIDEALVLWGDPVDIIRDDRVISELLKPLWLEHPGLDIFLITDTCFSQGNFRTFWSWITMSPPFVLNVLRDTGAAEVPIDGGLIQIAMCREGGTSQGGPFGGTGTQALIKVLKPGLGRLAAYYALLKELETSKQTPQWTEMGTITDLFRNGEFWK